MALIRKVLKKSVDGENTFAYVELNDEKLGESTILGGKEFETEDEAIQWSKGFSVGSYEYKEPELPETLGEKRVRVKFNPGNNDTVQNLKEFFAHGINRVEKLRLRKADYEVSKDSEKQRLISLSQTALEEAAMWAVKAATI